MNAGDAGRGQISQYILTYGDIADEKSVHFMQEMQHLARLQNCQYQTLFEILRHRGNLEAGEAGEKADEALTNFLSGFAKKYNLDVVRLAHYLGGPTYPDDPDSVAIFDADFSVTSGWEQAATEPIGDSYKRARILPAAMTTDKAIGFLRQTHVTFERERCQPVILALVKSPETVQQGVEAIGKLSVPIMSFSPKNAMQYVCLEMSMRDCLISDKHEPPQISSLHL
ncbi:MAG: hypothetical protein IT558_01835 [Alphaproteobacteria bacterium]|nr:hypothetical protein [Alphaproteobacteria bacterium]